MSGIPDWIEAIGVVVSIPVSLLVAVFAPRYIDARKAARGRRGYIRLIEVAAERLMYVHWEAATGKIIWTAANVNGDELKVTLELISETKFDNLDQPDAAADLVQMKSQILGAIELINSATEPSSALEWQFAIARHQFHSAARSLAARLGENIFLDDSTEPRPRSIDEWLKEQKV